MPGRPDVVVAQRAQLLQWMMIFGVEVLLAMYPGRSPNRVLSCRMVMTRRADVVEGWTRLRICDTFDSSQVTAVCLSVKVIRRVNGRIFEEGDGVTSVCKAPFA